MASAEQAACLGDEAGVVGDQVGAHVEGGRAVARHVDLVNRRGARCQRDAAVELPGQHGGIDEGCQRDRLELQLLARPIGQGESRAVLPAGRQSQGGRVDEII